MSVLIAGLICLVIGMFIGKHSVLKNVNDIRTVDGFHKVISSKTYAELFVIITNLEKQNGFQ